jgi:hypothetical protein
MFEICTPVALETQCEDDSAGDAVKLEMYPLRDAKNQDLRWLAAALASTGNV